MWESEKGVTGAGENKRKESHHTQAFGILWDNELPLSGRSEQVRGAAVKQEDRRKAGKEGGCKGGLGWVFLACEVGEGGIFSRGFSRGVYLELGCVKKTEGEQEGCALYTNARLM